MINLASNSHAAIPCALLRLRCAFAKHHKRKVVPGGVTEAPEAPGNQSRIRTFYYSDSVEFTGAGTNGAGVDPLAGGSHVK